MVGQDAYGLGIDDVTFFLTIDGERDESGTCNHRSERRPAVATQGSVLDFRVRLYFAGRVTSIQTSRWSEASINAVPGAPSTGQKTPAATTSRPAEGST